MEDTRDIHYMAIALRLAERGIGNTMPSRPSVGCVIVKDNQIVGRGYTGPNGIPHAEAIALQRAGKSASGATAYVTLEPCAHQGRTPPCAHALVDAGIARVVIATIDLDPRVNAQGIAILKNASIEVHVGCLGEIAEEQNAGFFLLTEKKRPFVTLKLATTLDGKIATRTGKSHWITGEHARAYAHLLRAKHDAIMVGVNTALQDDPNLTCRLPKLEHRSPIRIVMDSNLRLPETAQLIQTANHTATWLITCCHDKHRGDAEIVTVPANNDNHIDISSCLHILAQKGVTRLLIEGGSTLAGSFLQEKYVDQLIWFHAPKIIGGDGISAISELGLADMKHIKAFSCKSTRQLGDDYIATYAP